MRYRVVVTANAKRNLQDYYLHAARCAPLTAARWLERFERALETLALNPQRCSIALENDLVEQEIRQLLYGKAGGVYRALFTIFDDEVRVLHIRRAVRHTASPEELME